MSDASHKHCLDCGYILAGLPEPRCPECGRAFSPDDATSFADRRPRSGRPYLYIVLGLLLALIGRLAVNFRQPAKQIAPDFTRVGTYGWLAMVLWALLLVMNAIAWVALRRTSPPYKHRRSLWSAFFISGLVCIALLL